MFVLSLFAPAFSATLRVDPAGGGDFTSLNEAIASAADGDTLILAAGDYAGITMQNRELSFVAASPGQAKLGNWTVEGGSISLVDVRFDHVGHALTTTGHVLMDGVSIVGSAPGAEQLIQVGNGGSLNLYQSSVEEVVALKAAISVGEGGKLSAVDTLFRANQGQVVGAVWAAGEVSLDGSLFSNNTGAELGGAIALAGGSLHAVSSGFDNNSGRIGGAIQAIGATIGMEDVSFAGNHASLAGGQLWLGSQSNAVLSRVMLDSGAAVDGAGVFVEESTLHGNNLIIEHGEATGKGGAIAAMSGEVNLGFVVVARNNAASGGGIYVGLASLSLDSSIVVWNQGVGIQNQGGQVAMDYSLFWGQPTNFAGQATVGAHNQFADPLFMSPTEYVLSSQSPALDSASNQFIDLDHTMADMGAFGGPEAWALPDMDGDGEIIGRDCNDTDPSINLHSVDTWYDGIDSNCDFANDFDQDGDGWVAAAYGGADCDDTTPLVSPNGEEQPGDSADSDCDGLTEVDEDGDGYPVGVDCNDKVATTYPGAEDAWYDGVDSDCDGGSDWDADRDGYTLGYADCDDTNPGINIDAPEIAGDGIDQDCRGADLEIAETTEEFVETVEGIEPAPIVHEEPVMLGCSTGKSNLTGLFSILLGIAALFRRTTSKD